MELETARLRLRPFTPADADDLYRLYSDPEVMRYIGQGTVRTREQTAEALAKMIDEWEQHGFGMWALFDRRDGRFLGRCGLRPLPGTPEVELGYTLFKEAWGKGLATEAARASVAFGFEKLALPRIVAIAHPPNRASRRVMEKVGMRFERQAPYQDIDCVWYAAHRADYLAAPRAEPTWPTT
jgi:ribosomal-protein-alanine N-acetyltransferase